MATCKDCIHSDVCTRLMRQMSYNPVPCSIFKDRARFPELPCKVGNIIFIPSHEKIHKDVVKKL